MDIKTKYGIGDVVYVYTDNVLKEVKVNGIYANTYRTYPAKGGSVIKTVIGYKLSGVDGSIGEEFVHGSIKEAKEKVVIVLEGVPTIPK
tara:strand:+ start:105 stop:371 length:267 start_codon:yes stop_codon:yes gene_type:complete